MERLPHQFPDLSDSFDEIFAIHLQCRSIPRSILNLHNNVSVLIPSDIDNTQPITTANLKLKNILSVFTCLTFAGGDLGSGVEQAQRIVGNGALVCHMLPTSD